MIYQQQQQSPKQYYTPAAQEPQQYYQPQPQQQVQYQSQYYQPQPAKKLLRPAQGQQLEQEQEDYDVSYSGGLQLALLNLKI